MAKTGVMHFFWPVRPLVVGRVAILSVVPGDARERGLEAMTSSGPSFRSVSMQPAGRRLGRGGHPLAFRSVARLQTVVWGARGAPVTPHFNGGRKMLQMHPPNRTTHVQHCRSSRTVLLLLLLLLLVTDFRFVVCLCRNCRQGRKREGRVCLVKLRLAVFRQVVDVRHEDMRALGIVLVLIDPCLVLGRLPRLVLGQLVVDE